MKLVAAVVLVFAIFCSSTLALAEGPVPFKALMRNDGAQPGIPQDANGQSAAAPGQPAHKTHMARSGKIMVGVGIGFLAIGGMVFAVTPHTWSTPTDRKELYSAAGATMGTGVVLIVFGARRHSAQ